MLEFHPLANLFPLIEGKDFDELVADVRANGLREKIILHEGKILDGRNRYRAAIEAGRMSAKALPGRDFRVFDDDEGDPLAWVLSKNLHRRHLSENQRVMIAAEIAKLRQGRPSEWDKDRDDKPANRPDSTQAEAAELMHVSERQVRRGRVIVDQATPELVDAVKNDRVAISAASELARLGEDEQLEVLRTVPAGLIAKAAKERQRVGNASRSIMASRVEPPDSLDYFPTPPWATRALIEDVLCADAARVLGTYPGVCGVWEPACGEGHMAGVLQEYFAEVVATDVFDYSVNEVAPPAWRGRLDFLGDKQFCVDLVEGAGEAVNVRWIISNAPFTGEDGIDRTLAFALRALELVPCVALFVRSQWAAEGLERYARLFSEQPPTLVAHFAERVNLCKGRWDPNGSTATAYSWLIWVRGAKRQPTMWIKPGRRSERTRPDDVERFTASPVRSLVKVLKDRPDEPTDTVEGGPPAELDRPIPEVAAPEAEAGEGGSAPTAESLPGFRSSPESDAIIRKGYESDPVDLVAIALALKAALKLAEAPTKLQVRRRANQLDLGNRDRQRAAVVAANKRRAQPKEAAL